MTKRERDFVEILASSFANERLLPLVPLIWILIAGTAVWAIDSDQFEYWFPGVLFISGLLIVLGKSIFKWLRNRRK